jgi:hypothetical protein
VAKDEGAYSFCFLAFGPGFPRALGPPSTAAAPLFVPAFDAGLFRFAPVAGAGGASRPLSGALVGADAALGGSTGVCSTMGAGVSGDEEDLVEGSWGNLASLSGDSRSTTILLFVADALVVDILGTRAK